MYAAIPTLYAGVQFRSRLEARYASLFDHLGIKWAYEPVDLRGYIPDFLLTPTGDSQAKALVEIKPGHDVQDLFDAGDKIQRSGWRDEAAILGVDPTVCLWSWGVEDYADICPDTPDKDNWRKSGHVFLPGYRRWNWSEMPPILEAYDTEGNHFSGAQIMDAWREAGNETQYKSPRRRRP